MAQTEFPVAWDSVCRSAIALCLSGVYVLLAMITFYLFSHRSASGTSGRVVFMCAIAVMLFLTLTEIALRLASTALSIRLLYSKIPDSTAGTISSSAQAALQHAYNTAGFVADLILITNNAVADGLFGRAHLGFILCDLTLSSCCRFTAAMSSRVRPTTNK
ncbi:hypothetical protein C8R43DRAFT_1240275 [Mycena crocata]|nr:hypothetical protein C8R43DRAFT_1240275 [Mycena crocata]